jgi:hypothetical protein
LFGDTLYKKLSSKKTYDQEDDDGYKSELEYLKYLRDIRDTDPDLFKKIKLLPKKARSAKSEDSSNDGLITFFRKGKLKKFIHTNGLQVEEKPFFDAVNIFKCEPNEKRKNVPKEYYDYLMKNKSEFDQITLDEMDEAENSPGGMSNEKYVILRLKVKDFYECASLTDDDEDFINVLKEKYSEGIIPKNISKRIKQEIEKLTDPLKILGVLKREIPSRLLGARNIGIGSFTISKREVILSEWLEGKDN